jgi:hypothetical protein
VQRHAPSSIMDTDPGLYAAGRDRRGAGDFVESWGLIIQLERLFSVNNRTCTADGRLGDLNRARASTVAFLFRACASGKYEDNDKYAVLSLAQGQEATLGC